MKKFAALLCCACLTLFSTSCETTTGGDGAGEVAVVNSACAIQGSHEVDGDVSSRLIA